MKHRVEDVERLPTPPVNERKEYLALAVEVRVQRATRIVRCFAVLFHESIVKDFSEKELLSGFDVAPAGHLPVLLPCESSCLHIDCPAFTGHVRIGMQLAIRGRAAVFGQHAEGTRLVRPVALCMSDSRSHLSPRADVYSRTSALPGVTPAACERSAYGRQAGTSSGGGICR